MQQRWTSLSWAAVVLMAVVVSVDGACPAQQVSKVINTSLSKLSVLQRQTGLYSSLALVPSVCLDGFQRPVQDFWSDLGNKTTLAETKIINLMGCMSCSGRPVGDCDSSSTVSLEAYSQEVYALAQGFSVQMQTQCTQPMTDAVNAFPAQFSNAVNVAITGLAGCLG